MEQGQMTDTWRFENMRRVAACILGALLALGGLAPTASAARTFPGDNGRIVFVRGGDIWTMTKHGRNETRLTRSKARDTLPTVSPSGRTIAFTRVRGRYRAAILTMRMDGGRLTRLTSFRGASVWPRFSPDGTRILYTWSPGEDVSQVRVMDRDGGNKRKLTGRSFNGDPIWSPSGTRIAYWNALGSRPGLYVMRANGSGKRRILRDPLSSLDAWGPGRRILYTTSDGHVATIRSNGSGKRLLTDGDARNHSPSYSPDGARIAFQRCRRSDCRFFVIDPDGSTRRISGRTRASDGPTWSPDGRRVVVPFFRPAQRRWDLRLLTMRGAGAWLTRGGGIREGAAWQAR